MRFKQVGNKVDKIFCVARNAEASATIPKGTPCCLAYNATEDGLAVVLPSSSSAAKSIVFRYGVAATDIVAGAIGEVQTFGECDYALLTLQTRANTSGGSSFSTAQTVALGELLTIATALNAFSTLVSTTAYASTDAFTLSQIANNIGAVMGQSLASAAGVATTTSNTLTVVTQAVKAFLRMM